MRKQARAKKCKAVLRHTARCSVECAMILLPLSLAGLVIAMLPRAGFAEMLLFFAALAALVPLENLLSAALWALLLMDAGKKNV